MHSRHAALLVTAGTVVMLLLGASVPSAAGGATEEGRKKDPRAGEGSASEVMNPAAKGVVGDTQRIVRAPGDAAITALSGWLEVRGEGAGTGWSGARLDDGRLHIYWKGRVPDSLKSALAEAREPHVFEATSFSETDFAAAIQPLLMSGYGITSAGPNATFNAIEATLTEGAPSHALPRSAGGIPIVYSKDPRMFTFASGVGDDAAVPSSSVSTLTTLPSRGDDRAPFYGGGQVAIPSGGICAVAFSVKEPDGTPKLITARHCGVNTQFSTPAGTIIGASGGGLASLDSVLIANPSLPSMSAARTFTGPWTSTTSLPVSGPRSAVVGEGMCANGAWSGQRCRNEIIQANTWVYSTQLGLTIGPGFWSEQVDSLAQAGLGDSGSAAVKFLDNPDSVRVLGVLSGIDAAPSSVRPCQGLTGGRTCSSRAFYVRVGALLAGHGVTLSIS